MSRDSEYEVSRLATWIGTAPDLAEQFAELRARWERETEFSSSATDIVLNQSYQRIIGLGPAVLPHIIAAMREKPGFWGWALRAITGEDPVPREVAGDTEAITAAWLEWAERRELDKPDDGLGDPDARLALMERKLRLAARILELVGPVGEQPCTLCNGVGYRHEDDCPAGRFLIWAATDPVVGG